MVHIFVELIKKAIRPDINIARFVQLRANCLSILSISWPEEVQGNLLGFKPESFYGPANAVENVITMGFDNYLDTGTGNVCQKMPHKGLSSRVEVYFGIFNQ